MNIIQTVTVKQVLTENSKHELLEGYAAKKKQLQKECDQLRFELKKQEKTKKLHPAILKQHFEKEIQMRHEKVQLLDFQIEQLHMLPLGSELKEKEVQAIIEVQKGTPWEEIEKGKTIIIRDGIVDEIR
ncbi:YlqD family protein [Cytobacillus firmus]|uniref:YlqD family protein n=1 Tax=Cytobacillus firmus TaxID=1399 RepID=UPI00218C186B|nr:YlqD family protein [Cytobacillus firmus]URM31735.1 YlqD family protein [Cytobacillus firmus]